MELKGSVRKRGNTYEYRVDMGRRADGTRRQISKGGFATKEAAQFACAQFTEQNREEYKEATKARFSEAILHWMTTEKQPFLKPSTYYNYDKVVKERLTPVFGRKKVKDIKREDIRIFVSALIKEKLEPSYIHYVLAVLKNFFKYCEVEELISTNPTVNITLPTIKKKEKAIWDKNQYNQFLRYTSKDDFIYHSIYTTALYTGMRQGELLALRWCDVDFKNKRIHVRKSLIYLNNVYISVDPKTPSSIRKISVNIL